MKFISKPIFIACFAIAALSATVAFNRLQPPVSADKLKLGVPQRAIEQSKDFVLLIDDMETAEKGYGTPDSDGSGAKLMARCRGGQCTAIQVIFGSQPAARDIAMSHLMRLLPDKLPLVEHDDREVVNRTCPQPTEYFYFGRHYKAEIGYSKTLPHKVVWVNAWYDRDHRDRS